MVVSSQTENEYQPLAGHVSEAPDVHPQLLNVTELYGFETLVHVISWK